MQFFFLQIDTLLCPHLCILSFYTLVRLYILNVLCTETAMYIFYPLIERKHTYM